MLIKNKIKNNVIHFKVIINFKSLQEKIFMSKNLNKKKFF